jgi:hypothetical protein
MAEALPTQHLALPTTTTHTGAFGDKIVWVLGILEPAPFLPEHIALRIQCYHLHT